MIEIDSVSHRSVIKDSFVVEVRLTGNTGPARASCTHRGFVGFGAHGPQRLQEEIYWLVRKEFLRGHLLADRETAPVNRMVEFFSTVSVKFWEILRPAGAVATPAADAAAPASTTADAAAPGAPDSADDASDSAVPHA